MTTLHLHWIQAVCVIVLFNVPTSVLSNEHTPADRGRMLVIRMCGSCHAVERSGTSPHPGAPPFRHIERRVDLDSFHERLRQGLFSGNSDMPQFRFNREEARSVQAYLRSIQGR